MSAQFRPWFPYLFALALPVTVYSHNQAAFAIGDLLRPAAASLILAALLVHASRRVVQDRALADTLASAPILGIWLLGCDWQLFLILSVLTPFCLSLRHKRAPSGMVPTLNALALGLLLWPTLMIMQVESEATPLVRHRLPTSPFLELRTQQMFGDRPDIYHIVLDAYAGRDALSEELGFDNSEFFEQLRDLGFTVGDSVVVPYNETVHVMSSVFIGDYLKAGEYPLDQEVATLARSSMGALIPSSPVHEILRRNGYSLVYTDPGHEFLRFPEDARVIKADDRFQLNQFERHLGNVTSLDLRFPRVFAPTPEDPLIRSLKSAFANDYAGIESPKFVYQHVVAPHTPFTIDRHGEYTTAYGVFATTAEGDSVVQNDPERRRLYVSGYLEKLLYVNGQTLDQVRRLLASPRQKIIIIHGDHGSGSRYHTNDASKTCLRERFTSFIAVYADVPHVRDNLEWISGPDATPVNLYRSIFSSLFRVPLRLLPRHSYFVNFKTPHQLETLDPNLIARNCDEDGIAPPDSLVAETP